MLEKKNDLFKDLGSHLEKAATGPWGRYAIAWFPLWMNGLCLTFFFQWGDFFNPIFLLKRRTREKKNKNLQCIGNSCFKKLSHGHFDLSCELHKWDVTLMKVSTLDCQTTSWMMKPEFFFNFSEQILKWRLVQIGHWNHKSLLLILANINCKEASWYIWGCRSCYNWSQSKAVENMLSKRCTRETNSHGLLYLQNKRKTKIFENLFSQANAIFLRMWRLELAMTTDNLVHEKDC